MKDLHKMFSEFKKDFPDVYASYEALGAEIHGGGGPLSEKTRWLLKIAVSGASHHMSALETHLFKGKEAGLTNAEIKHTLLLLLQTAGFPTFMEAYSVYKKME
ncbi:MAG: carboxymuconolactone decarboxylase family protein [Desulfuromonadaceae bacterium]